MARRALRAALDSAIPYNLQHACFEIRLVTRNGGYRVANLLHRDHLRSAAASQPGVRLLTPDARADPRDWCL